MTMLTTGVTSGFRVTSTRRFNLGGIGRHTSARPFDILSPLASVTSTRPFTIQGLSTFTSQRPFDLGTKALWTSPRHFDIISEADGAPIDDIVYAPPQTDAVNATQRVDIQATGGTFTITFDGQTTAAIAYDAAVGAVQTALEGLSNVGSGDVVVTGTPGAYVIEFVGQYAAMTVAQVSVDPTGLTGTTTTPPSGTSRVVTPGTPHGGATVMAGIQVYDKAGERLGAILEYSIGQPPSRAIAFRGSFGFSVPRELVDPKTGNLHPNPDLELLPDGAAVKGDRLVVIGDSTQPDNPWAGYVTHIEYTDGAAIVNCTDITDLLSSAELPADDSLRATEAIVIPSGTIARAMVPIIVEHANNWYARNGEIQWSYDATGSETFFGYQRLSGSAAGALDTLVRRSFAEWTWRVDLTATSMTPVVVWRDEFSEGVGPALSDGPDGNIVEGYGMSTDPTRVINGVRVTGSVTKIESKIPAGAVAEPYTEIIPVAEVWEDAEGYRRRVEDQTAGFLWEVQVEWSLDGAAQDGIATAEEARRRQQFRDFIRGFHAQFGRPWHDGWSWNGGAGSDDEHELYELGLDNDKYLSQDNWVHFRQMGVLGWDNVARPVAIVMRRRGWEGQPQTYKQYTVRGGDHLWKISKKLYGHGNMWDELFRINRGRIRAANQAKGINPYGPKQYRVHKGTVLDYPSKSGTTFHGQSICVYYDRVNAMQVVFGRRRPRVVPTSTVFDFEWRRYRMGQYDPKTQGVGQDSPFRTVKGGRLRTRSWRVVPSNAGGSGSTSLLYGITAGATKVPVVSVLPLPTQFPFVTTVGTDEKMLVKGIHLNVMTVERGYDGTTASIHEAGEPVEYEVLEDDEEDDAYESTTPDIVPWPEGEAYAKRLLQEVRLPKRQWTLHVANVGGHWSRIRIGTTHTLNLTNEGPAGGMSGTVRVLGYAPDVEAGTKELIVEDA